MIAVIYGAGTYGLLEQHGLALEDNIQSTHVHVMHTYIWHKHRHTFLSDMAGSLQLRGEIRR